MTDKEIALEMVRIGKRTNVTEISDAELFDAYMQAITLGMYYVIHDSKHVMAYVLWAFCDGKEDAQKAFSAYETSGPDLYIRDLYVDPEHSYLIWKVKGALPKYRSIYFHRYSDNLKLKHHANPNWRDAVNA